MSRGTTFSYRRASGCQLLQPQRHRSVSHAFCNGKSRNALHTVQIFRQILRQLQPFSSKATFRIRHPGGSFSPESSSLSALQCVLLFLNTLFNLSHLSERQAVCQDRFCEVAIKKTHGLQKPRGPPSPAYDSLSVISSPATKTLVLSLVKFLDASSETFSHASRLWRSMRTIRLSWPISGPSVTCARPSRIIPFDMGM